MTFTNQNTSNIVIDNNGKLGKCYKRTAANTAGRIISNSNINLNSNLSMCCWAKVTATPGDSANGLISNHSHANNTGFGICVKQISSTDYRISCSTGNGNGRTYNTYYGTSNIKDAWHHLALTYNHTTHIFQLWVDGVVEVTQSYTNASQNDKILIFDWSTTYDATSYRPACMLNDVRIYDHCLSAKEVEEIAKGLVLHYKLDQGNPNLLSKYVTPGQAAPGSTASGGRTIYNGDYSIIIPASENADTYFRLFLTKQLIQGNIYTISCYVSGLLSGSSYNFPLFSQGNTSMGILQLNHNGLCSLTFTMNSSAQNAVTTPDGSTVYVCFLDDSSRTLASGQGKIILSGFKLEEGNFVTPWIPSNLTTIYDSSGYNNNGTIVGSLETITPSPRYSYATKMTNGQYIRVNNKPAVCMPKDAITVNLWQYATSWANPISCTEGGGWNFETSNGIRFPIYISGVGYKLAQSSITPASTLNAWHMLTGTMDKDNIKIYYDGEEVGTVANGSTNGIGYANNYIFIGAEAQGDNISPADSSYTGNLSDIRIYATALTAKQIKELYNTSMAIDNQGNIYARELVEI